MTIVGFAFKKMLAEKAEGISGKINISNNVSITDVKQTKLPLATGSQEGIRFSFSFSSKYEPKAGEIKFEGNVLYMESKDKAKKIISSWKKEKKIEKDIMRGILNTILTRCNIQALIISKEINLPPPIPLPKVGTKN